MLGALFTPEHPAATKRWPANLIAHLTDSQQALRRLPFILAIIGLPLALMMLSKPYEARWNRSDQDDQLARREACYSTVRRLLYSGALNQIGPTTEGKILLAPTDLGAEILFWTPHRIIASNYHREGDAIAYVWDADHITNLNELHRYLQKRNVEALLICPTVGTPPASALQQLLSADHPPAWLENITYTAPTKPTSKPETAKSAPRIYLLNTH